jgi:C_GCAxxG_C_C family probable redox protein
MENVALRMLELKFNGYCCVQIMLLMALDAQGKKNADLVRTAGGLCNGVGMSGEICGALSGGICILSLYTGKGSHDEETDRRYPLMANELIEWFRTEISRDYGGIRCADIIRQNPDKSACSPIVVATYEKTFEILIAHGLDPSSGREA